MLLRKCKYDLQRSKSFELSLLTELYTCLDNFLTAITVPPARQLSNGRIMYGLRSSLREIVLHEDELFSNT